MKKQRIFAFYFFPIIYVILGGIMSIGMGIAIILDLYVYNNFKLIKSEWITLSIFILVVAFGIFLIFRDKITITDDCCIEKLYNKTIKTINYNNIKRIIVTRTPFKLKGGTVKRKSIIIDDGTFQEANLPINCFHYCPKNVSWILIDYSTKRIQKIKTVLP